MSVTRTYRCDLCRDEETPRDHTGPAVELIGFEYKSSGVGAGIVMKGSRQVERHVCKSCLKGLKDLYYAAGGEA